MNTTEVKKVVTKLMLAYKELLTISAENDKDADALGISLDKLNDTIKSVSNLSDVDLFGEAATECGLVVVKYGFILTDDYDEED
ncbi:MAG: hypothetical protein PUD51_02620 [Prevotellaceae bacterium]|nr:hypothetical protein [Prevotellaceae bacterium]